MAGAKALDDVVAYLDAQNLTGGSTGWVAKAGYMPDDPDQVIVIMQQPGQQPESDESGIAEQDYPDFIVYARAGSFASEAAYAKAEAVRAALHGSAPSSSFTYVFATTSVYSSGMDQNTRPVIGCSYKGMRDR